MFRAAEEMATMNFSMLGRLTHGTCLVLLLLCSIACVQVLAADGLRIIELTDGSTISGRVVSLQDGIYTIESDSLGGLQLDESKILSIRSQQTGVGAQRGFPGGFDPEALQHRITEDPELMKDIMALQNDRQIQEILGDPAILQDLQSGNIGALTQDPRIIELLNHPRIKLIQRKILGR